MAGKINDNQLIIDKVNVAELSHNKLLKFTKALHEELETERQMRLLLQEDRNEINVFWEITRDRMNKLQLDMVEVHRSTEEKVKQISDLETKLTRQRFLYLMDNRANLDKARMENENAARTLKAECHRQTSELFELITSLRGIIDKMVNINNSFFSIINGILQ